MKIFTLLDILFKIIFFPLVWIWFLSLAGEFIFDIKDAFKSVGSNFGNKKATKKRKTAYVNSRSKKFLHKQSFN